MKVRKVVWTAAVLLACLGVDLPAAQNAAQESSATVAPKRHDQHEQGQGERRPGQRGPRRWWMDPSDRAELDITDAQSAKIEAIWQAHRGPQWERIVESRKLEEVVEKLIKEGTAEPEHLGREVQRLENLKAKINTERILMLYRQLRELTPAQREKLRRMQERREAERKTTESQQRR